MASVVGQPPAASGAGPEGSFQLDLPGYNVLEGTAFTVNVERIGGSTLSKDVTVTVALADGNLKPIEACPAPIANCDDPNDPKFKPDYDPEQVAVTFPAGTNLTSMPATFQTFNKVRTNDQTKFTVKILTVSAGTLGTPSSATLVMLGSAAPRVDSVFPRSAAQGSQVRLTGQRFTGVDCSGPATIKFGTVVAQTCNLIDDTTLDVTVPAGMTLGEVVQVVIDAGGGYSAGAGLANRFTAAGLNGMAIHSISPTHGIYLGGTILTLAGEGFNALVGTDSVSFDATLVGAAGYTVINDSQMTVVSPPGAGVVDVQLVDNGLSALSPITVDTVFTFDGGPEITDVSPSAGPPGGGTPVVITGSGFTPNNIGGVITSVLFGGVAGTALTVVNDSTILVTTPNGSGSQLVTLQHVTLGFVAPGATFLFTSAPIVTALTPGFGPTAGGGGVMITGFNFVDGATVAFGGVAALATNFVSPTQLSVVAPPGSGTVDVRVTVGATISPNSSADDFTYSGPEIAQLTPNAGDISVPVPISITGKNFTTDAVVLVNGVIVQTTFVDTTHLLATAPASSARAVQIVVRTASGDSAQTPLSLFTYTNGPVVESVNPNGGVTGGGTIVVVTGQRLTGATTVNFGAASTSNLTVNDDGTELTAISPPNALGGVVDVRVTSPTGISPITPGGEFLYAASAPVILLLEPASSLNIGNEEISIQGSGFLAVACGDILFGATPAKSCTVVSDSEILAVTPVHPSGLTTVTVRNNVGISAIMDNFEFIKWTSDDDSPVPVGDIGEPIQLSFRWSLVTWVGTDEISVSQALAGVDGNVVSIYAWRRKDAASPAEWFAYFPAGANIPGANDLLQLRYGEAYWVAIGNLAGATWITR